MVWGSGASEYEPDALRDLQRISLHHNHHSDRDLDRLLNVTLEKAE